MILPAPRVLERLVGEALTVPGVDFAHPPGEAAVVGPGSVSWRVFRNPVTMYVGGVAAVLLELGEPRVRHGVWDHSDFRRDPAGRLRRTGQAAMVTVYGARSAFEALAARVNRLHARVAGATAAGERYAASDPELLRWVQATAAWGFVAAYARYARPLTAAEVDRYYAEGRAGAALYGVADPPASRAELEALLAATAPRLEPSPVLHELLAILRRSAILPAGLRPLQASVVAAAVDLLPADLRHRLRLDRERRSTAPERALLAGMARLAERTHFARAPYAVASRRLGLPADHVLRLNPAGGAPPRS
jgi:uncharacterized protein (DUF2236 family)